MYTLWDDEELERRRKEEERRRRDKGGGKEEEEMAVDLDVVLELSRASLETAPVVDRRREVDGMVLRCIRRKREVGKVGER